MLALLEITGKRQEKVVYSWRLISVKPADGTRLLLAKSVPVRKQVRDYRGSITQC